MIETVRSSDDSIIQISWGKIEMSGLLRVDCTSEPFPSPPTPEACCVYCSSAKVRMKRMRDTSLRIKVGL